MIKFFYDEKMDEFRWGHIIGGVVALIVAIILAFSMIKTVPTGYTGILTTFGKVEPKHRQCRRSCDCTMAKNC